MRRTSRILSAGQVRFVSRNRKSLTERFPELQGVAASIKAETAILDGEIVALDQAGMPCFNALRSRKITGCKVVFYAFDLLHLDGQDLTHIPLLIRKRLLKKVISKRSTSRLRYTDHIVGEGEKLFAELERTTHRRSGSVLEAEARISARGPRIR